MNAKIDEFLTNSKNKNIRGLYKVINDFKKVTSLILIEYMVRKVVCLQTPTVFWWSGRIISLSYGMCKEVMMLGRQLYIQKSL